MDTLQDGRWVEDEDYLTFLDTDWDVSIMRDAAYRALNAVGDDVMHFRPPDEQNDHKITCGVMVLEQTHCLKNAHACSSTLLVCVECVRVTCSHPPQVGVLDQVEDRLRVAMRESGVKAQVITSGTGDWCVCQYHDSWSIGAPCGTP